MQGKDFFDLDLRIASEKQQQHIKWMLMWTLKLC